MHNKIRNVFLILSLFAGTMMLLYAQDAEATYTVGTKEVSFSTDEDTKSNASGNQIGSGFTYQGYLDESGSPANGLYDFEFRLFNAAAVGVQVGNTDTELDVAVVNGVFSVVLSPGPNVFHDGSTRWLEIRVRPAGAGSFVKLNPRQEIRPVPQAVYAKFASNLIGTSNTIVHVSPYDMIQSDGFSSVNFAAKGNGRLQLTSNSLGERFVYVPVDIPSRPFGTQLKLRSLYFCYSGDLHSELGVLAGIDRATVRQTDNFSTTNLLGEQYVPVLADKDDCVVVRADEPQPVEGSLWIRFKVITSSVPLEFGEMYLTLESEN